MFESKIQVHARLEDAAAAFIRLFSLVERIAKKVIEPHYVPPYDEPVWDGYRDYKEPVGAGDYIRFALRNMGFPRVLHKSVLDSRVLRNNAVHGDYEPTPEEIAALTEQIRDLIRWAASAKLLIDGPQSKPRGPEF